MTISTIQQRAVIVSHWSLYRPGRQMQRTPPGGVVLRHSTDEESGAGKTLKISGIVWYSSTDYVTGHRGKSNKKLVFAFHDALIVTKKFNFTDHGKDKLSI